MREAVRKLRLYASHRQFYVQDCDPCGDTGAPSFWTDQACKDELAVADGILGIGTASYGSVKVVVEVHDAEPPLQLADWDHATEAGLEVASGTLRVIGCLENQGADFQVEPGPYRVRCCHANRAGRVDHGAGADWYLVQVWPGDEPTPRVLKHWKAKGS